jgi:glycine cleavage system transcriptional repressor
MRKNIVFTLTGSDRVGLVEEVTDLFLRHGGNVETSRMSRLGGEFAILMLVSMPEEKSSGLDQGFAALSERGYKITACETEESYAEKYAGWQPFEIELQGADHEGIVHEVAGYLAGRGINIETMDTSLARAPMSGAPLFTMTAVVLVPPGLAGQDWEEDLKAVGHRLAVDISVAAAQRA